MFPMINILENEKIEMSNFKEILNNVIDSFIDKHTISKKAHEELMALSHLDEDVAEIFKNNEFEMSEKIVSLLKNNNINPSHLREKVHIIIGIVDNLCHEVVYHKHSQIDYDIMKSEVVNIIVNILN